MKIIKIIILICVISISAFSQKSSKVKIKQAESLKGIKRGGVEIRRLIGNVIFEHDGVLMFCDSAYSFVKQNKLEAYGNVRIKQPDGATVFSDVLFYNGKSKVAELHDNVKMVDDSATLTTDKLIYSIKDKISYYNTGGKVEDKSNTLISIKGYYYSESKVVHFKDSVLLVNDDYTLETDTLKYNSNSSLVEFLGATNIYNDDMNIYCENGWYNTDTDISQYSKNAQLTSGNQILKGDTLFYDKNNGFAKGLSNVFVIDTAEDVIIQGDYTEFYENDESFFVTDSAVLIIVTDDDSLYMHADTLKSNYDSINDIRDFLAYNHVRFYQNSMQGKCDSLAYSSLDSTIRLFNEPIMWTDNNQMSAVEIEIHRNEEEIDNIVMINSALIISQESDSIKYNQISGSKITSYLNNNEINKVHVEGDGSTIYYGKDDNDNKYIGVNKASSPELVINIKNNELINILFLNESNGTFYPMKELSEEESKLPGFLWEDFKRPLSKMDIYEWK